MTKEDVLNYVMNTPENTNRMVLSDMLDKLANSGDKGGSSTLIATLRYEHEMYAAYLKSDLLAEDAATAIANGRSVVLVFDNRDGHDEDAAGMGIHFASFQITSIAKTGFDQNKTWNVGNSTTGDMGNLVEVYVNDDGYLEWSVYYE
jgi:hypothetical protein